MKVPANETKFPLVKPQIAFDIGSFVYLLFSVITEIHLPVSYTSSVPDDPRASFWSVSMATGKRLACLLFLGASWPCYQPPACLLLSALLLWIKCVTQESVWNCYMTLISHLSKILNLFPTISTGISAYAVIHLTVLLRPGNTFVSGQTMWTLNIHTLTTHKRSPILIRVSLVLSITPAFTKRPQIWG